MQSFRKVLNENGFVSIAVAAALIISSLALMAVTLPQVRSKIRSVIFPNDVLAGNSSIYNYIEGESASLNGPVSVGTDASASNGHFIQFTTSSGSPTPTPTSTPSPTPSHTPTPTPGSTGFQPSAPFYITFYYPWYKNSATDGGYSYWTDHGNNPPNTWFSHYLPDPNPSVFDPGKELYSSNDYKNFRWQVSKMAEAKLEVAMSSWWGNGTKEDSAFNNIINNFMGKSDNPYPNLRWAVYYEKEGFGDPTVATLVSELNHIKTQFSTSPYYFKVDGKPVIFVYSANEKGSSNSNCTDTNDTSATHRWYQANAQLNNYFYVVLKVYPGFASNPCQPNSWHEYAPATRSDHQASYFFVSPGFWLDDGSAERLPRDSSAFENAVKSMVASNATWKLVETWNEWGEGSAVEPGELVKLDTASGKEVANTTASQSYAFHNLYIDILARNLPSLSNGTGAVLGTSTVRGSTVLSSIKDFGLNVYTKFAKLFSSKQ